jgi:acyl carrier protein
MNAAIKNRIEKVVRRVAQERDLQLPELKDSTEIVDELGFSSLQVAALIANLEEEFGVDPFQDENVMITDVRTIKDLGDIYTRALEADAVFARADASRETQHA